MNNVKTKETIIRKAEIEDVIGISEVHNAAFHRTGNIKTQENDVRNNISSWHVAVENKCIIGTICIIKKSLWHGSATLVKGDVGEVTVSPKLQGQGIGSKLMNYAIKYMNENNYHVSRLGGLVKFYSRFGYHPFMRRYIELPITKEKKAGASIVDFSKTLAWRFCENGNVRTLNAPEDYRALWDIKEEFNYHRTGAQVFNRPQTIPEETDNNLLIYESNNEISGGLYYREFDEDFSAFERRITIGSLIYKKNKIEALEGLIKHILQMAFEKEINCVSLRMPFDNAILNDLNQIGVEYKTVEYQADIGSNMLQVINLKSLFESISRELSIRLYDYKWTGCLIIDIGKEKIALKIREGQVSVSCEHQEGIYCKINETDLLKMIFALENATKLNIHQYCNLNNETRLLLDILFPVQSSNSAEWC